MPSRHDLRPWPAIVFRVVVDLLIVNGSLLVAFAADYALRARLSNPVGQPLVAWISNYAWSLLWVSVVTIGIFALYGFYSRTRRYRARYKAVAIVQAVFVAYAVFAAGAYAFRFRMSELPATVIALSAGMTLGAILLVRLQSSLLTLLLDRGDDSSDLDLSHKSADQPALKVVVIGGAGYIGSALISHLVNRNYHVCVFDDFSFGEKPVAEWKNHAQVNLVAGDFRRVDQLVQVIQGAHAVVHLGGVVGDPACALDPDLTLEVNLTSSRVVAEVSRAQGVQRFIFASSCSVYGASHELLDEKSSLNPVSLYAKTKIAMENVLRELTTDSFRPTVLRFGTVFGLSGRTRFDLVVNLLTAKAVREGTITVFGPSQWRPFVHVSDAAKAVALSIEAPLEVAGAQTFNVGSNAMNLTLGELGRLIESRIPGAHIIESAGDDDLRNYRVRFNKIERELGFQPDWTLEEGIDQILEFLAAHPNLDFRSHQFSNSESLKISLLQSAATTLRAADLALLDETTGY